MSSKTKIIVLHLKELIYTGIFILLAILFLILMALMFLPGKKGEKPVFSDDVVRYVPGKYTTSLQIGSAGVDVEVVVDDSCITSIRLVNLSEAVTTMYPLMEPCWSLSRIRSAKRSPWRGSPGRKKTSTPPSCFWKRSRPPCKRPLSPKAKRRPSLKAHPVPSARRPKRHPTACADPLSERAPRCPL